MLLVLLFCFTDMISQTVEINIHFTSSLMKKTKAEYIIHLSRYYSSGGNNTLKLYN